MSAHPQKRLQYGGWEKIMESDSAKPEAQAEFQLVAVTPGMSAAGAAPISKVERLLSLDAVRGFALLGILLMNIAAWGLHIAAYNNPQAAGGDTGADLWFWTINHLLFEGKMRGLFSMVFGAGVIVLTTRLERRGASSADIYYRRLLWLLLFGILHAYLLWLGEILYPYALCGLALYPFRNMRPRSLIIISAVFILFTAGANVARVFQMREMKDKAAQAAALEGQGQKPSDEQAEAKKNWDDFRKMFLPGPEEIKKDAGAWLGSFGKLFKRRAELLMKFFHGSPYYSPWNWDIWAMMFLGMALFKLGVFSGDRSNAFYLKLVVACYGIGLAANSFSAWNLIRIRWDPVEAGFFNTTYDLGRLTIGLAHAGLVILLCKNSVMTWITRPLAAVGQMAFTQYVMQSVICSTIFYGYGFGLYSKLQRHELLYVVAGVWVFALISSPIWLRYFRFGPLEWLWRSLTYWKRQPFRVRPAPAAETAPGAPVPAG
jgi:uncharacterized protein